MSEYKILLAEITNFKGIRHRLITFDGRSAYLIGGNGKGKSSVIDAILSCINSVYVPTEPINNSIDISEERQKGVVRLQLGDQEKNVYEILAEYVPSLKSGKVSLMENGEVVKGEVKKKIKQIFGELSFDIYEFMHQSTSEQIKTLKELTGCAPEINAIESERSDKLSEKSHLERTIKDMQAVNSKDNRPFTKEEITKYAKEIPVDEISKELEAIQPDIDKYDRVKNGTETSSNKIEQIKQSLTRSHTETARIKQEMARLKNMLINEEKVEKALSDEVAAEEDKRAKGAAWLESHVRPDVTEISRRLGDAQEHNRMHAIVNVYRERQKDLFKKQEELEAVDAEVKALDQRKLKLIEGSQLPVRGLTFTDKQVFLDGLPFEQGQVNTQKYLEVGAKIAMAMNKKLKLVVIREASLFDDVHLQAVLTDLNEQGYMWLAEIVDREAGELQVIFEEEEIANE